MNNLLDKSIIICTFAARNRIHTETRITMGNNSTYVTIHPGAVLDKELKERGIAQKNFASIIGVPSPVLNAIIKEKRNITPSIAVLLEAALGKEASYWLSLQAQRDIEEAKKKGEFLRRQIDIETWICLQDFCNTSCLEKFLPNGLGHSISEKTKATLNFFGVNSLNGLRKLFLENVDPSFFRKSEKLSNNPINLFTWKYMAYYASERIDRHFGPFRKEGLVSLVDELKAIFYENQGTCLKIESLLAKYGIKFIILPNQQGVHVDGFSFWKGSHPSITLTLRGRKLDILAFTLLHEIYHVFNHLDKTNQNKTCISIDGEKSSREEKDADAFAKEMLIPFSDWQLFCTSNAYTNPYTMGGHIREFAHEHHIHPSIVLGRYQHDFNVFDNGRGIERSIN